MNLKYIEFILENCDSIIIDGKYVGEFIVDDLHTSFRRMASNYIGKLETADTFAIEIHKDADVERYQFGETQYEDFRQGTFERLLCKDITAIRFRLTDEEIREYEEADSEATDDYLYYVDWIGEDDYENPAQRCYVSEVGHLYMVIAAEKSIEDFFDLAEINDSDYMDFRFDMYGVGDEYSSPDRYHTEEEE
ncbi:MAG: hypothetical protein IJN16_10335 [Lachnospiraceae bacterium]|nr:hypothetical protein [Lachnospiraceae bacterium]